MSQDPISTSESSTRRNAVLTSQNPIEILDGLPPTVFPIETRFSISKRRTYDETDADYRKPDFPVELHHSSGVYVPETTVHFENPARRPPEGRIAWRPADFVEQLEALLEADITNDMTAADIAMSRFTIVEVPPTLVTTDPDTGSNAVKSELYSDEFEMSIARFQKHNSLSAAQVRNQLSDALPGESRTPVRLTDLHEVTAKPARHGQHTIGQSGRKRYYTEAEAEKTGDLSRTPSHYQSRYLQRESNRTRPLGPAVSELEEFLPDMVRDSNDLIQVVKFIGHEEESRSFVAEEVRT